jgi:hypothetical protein
MTALLLLLLHPMANADIALIEPMPPPRGAVAADLPAPAPPPPGSNALAIGSVGLGLLAIGALIYQGRKRAAVS